MRGARRRIIGLFVAGRDDRDRRVAIVRERVVEEFAHLAAGFADQPITTVSKSGLPGVSIASIVDWPTPTGEDSDALPGAQGGEEVDDADARLDSALRSRVRRSAGGGSPSIGMTRSLMRQLSAAVDRLSERVDRPRPFHAGAEARATAACWPQGVPNE